MQTRVAISQDFFSAFAAIPRQQQKKVNEFVSKFRDNPQAPGINYEKINDAANANYRSVRIDQDYRGIVLKPETGNVYLILWVDKHDAAYTWARRHKCQVNPETGSLQVYATLHSDQAQRSPELPPTGSAIPLLDLRDRELLRLGVPEEMLHTVKALHSEAELQQIQDQLPVEAYEALLFLAAGIPLDEVLAEYALPAGPAVNTDDLELALTSELSKRRFVVVDNELELQQMLEAPLEKWRVFLHPTQRKLVERHWNGPVRVLGGAGTGKTVVAMHRARWLVRNVLKKDERLLFTTFSRNLATDIEANLRKICSNDEMKQIEVININAWLTRFLKREKQPAQIVYPGEERFDSVFKRALALAPSDPSFPDTFYLEEWRQVVLPQRVLTQQDYFKASRLGRGVALSRKQRAALWPVFEEMRFQLHQAGYITEIEAGFLACDLLDEGSTVRPYRCAIVDEVQDFGIESLHLIRALVPPQQDDLMVVGDGHQRIYDRRSPLGKSGIDIRGRGRKLKLNYRTTEQIRRFATAVLEGQPVDDLDDGQDGQLDYRSLMQGQPPVVFGFPDRTAESTWVAKEIHKLINEGIKPQDICVVGRTAGEYKAIERALRDQNIDVYPIRRDAADNSAIAGIRVANMHRVKGLEFRVVFLVSINDGVVPLPAALSNTEDPVEKRSRELSERALIHVASSRAISGLYISWNTNPSHYLENYSQK